MASHIFDARRLDVAAFAMAAGRLSGAWPLAGFSRLLQDALPLAQQGPADDVKWSAQGEARVSGAGETQIRLHLHAEAALQLSCQRCLQPMTVRLDVRPALRFVSGEDEAQRLDEAGEEDVLALAPMLDLHGLVEDELILSLPLVPRHETCPQPLPYEAAGTPPEQSDEPAHPFASLAALRRAGGRGGNGGNGADGAGRG